VGFLVLRQTTFIYHYRDNQDAIEEIVSMPGQARYGVNRVVEALRDPVSDGLQSVLLFGVPSQLPKVCTLSWIFVVYSMTVWVSVWVMLA